MRNIYIVPSVSVLVVSSEALMRVSFVLVKKVFPLFSCSVPARLIHHYLSFFITLDGEKLSADFDIINEVQFKVLKYLQSKLSSSLFLFTFNKIKNIFSRKVKS